MKKMLCLLVALICLAVFPTALADLYSPALDALTYLEGGAFEEGYLDLLVTYAQPAPDASAAWQMMHESCRDVVDALLLQEGVSLEPGEYLDYEP